MKLKRLLISTLAVAMSVSMLVGCGSNSKEETNAEVVINLGTEPSDLNSITSTGSIDGNVLRHCMEGLITLDENDEAIPGVAKEVPTVENGGISEDGLTYTFKLREDSKWSNGETVTAKDFEFAFTALFTRGTAADYADTWAPLIVGAENLLKATKNITVDKVATEAKDEYEARGWKALDDTTFEVKLNAPCTYFVPLMAFINFYPVNEEFYLNAGSKYATEADQLMYNGAFIMTSWQHENNLVLEKNENYWDNGSIKLSKITMEMITDPNTIINRYNEGTIDMIGLNAANKETLENAGKGDLIAQYNDGSNFYLEFNTNVKGLNNAKVRKALTLALDAETFVKSILKNSSTVANSFTPAAIQNGEFANKVGDLVHRDQYDTAAIQALLEEGLAEENMKVSDLDITILMDDGDDVKKQGAFVQEQFKKIGVTLNVEQVTYQTRLQRMSDKKFDITFAGWGPDYNDPMTFMDLWLTGAGNNHTSWSNAKYDELISKARVEGDAAVRENYLIEAEKILAEEMPVGYVYCRVRDYACSERLTGVRRTAFQDINLKYAEVK